ncbi:MAG: twin-arginine translocase subunit TatC [Alphaproteobacteria bacterium]|nr:twin-arginine translocase subunit TatC [Alphaproteobacteria bacterium]
MKNMTLLQHFSELRRRILWVVLIFVIALICGWYLSPYVQGFLTQPLLAVWPDGTLLYTGLSDGLMIRFSLSVLFAMLIIMPVGLWHVWAFVAPGLKKNERKFIWPVLILSPVLFVIGAGFAFYFLFPMVFRFFVELNQSAMIPNLMLPAARDYLSFAIGMLKIFGIAFQLPLVLVLLNRLGVVSKSSLIKVRRYVLVLIVIIAAVLTPPDVVSQILLALPLWFLFEISILFMRRD